MAGLTTDRTEPSGRRVAAVVAAAIVAVGALIAVPPHVAAECIGGYGPWPSVREIAPTARRVIVGRVTRDLDPHNMHPGLRHGRPDSTTIFEFEVQEVLRGADDAGDSVVISRPITPGVRLSGPCWQDAVLRVFPGDVVGLAFGGRDRHGHTGVNVATWVIGGFGGECFPECVETDRMTIPEIRRVMGVLPTDAYATARGPVWQR